MKRRQFITTGTIGITALAGCSESDQPQNEIGDLTESANEHAEQAHQELDDADRSFDQKHWDNAAGSAASAADSFSDAEGVINTALDRTRESGNDELTEFLENYQALVSAGTSVAASLEQAAESMIDDDRESAQSHLERVEEYSDKMKEHREKMNDAEENL